MNNKLVSGIVDITYILSTVVFFIVTIMTFSTLNNSNYSYMHSLGVNWNNGPIVSINTEGRCGQNENYLITDAWPGTTSGCYCSFSLDIFNGPLRSGYCSRKKSTFTCNDVRPTLPIQYTKWRGEALCGERFHETYLDLTIAKSEQSCPMNTRSCGILDSLNNVMCVPNTTPCPFNYMAVIPSNQTIPNDRNYTILKGEGATMIFSNGNTKGKIIDEFEISDGQPCADPYYKNYASTPYMLDPFYSRAHCNKPIENKQYDDRYWLLDTDDKTQVLRDNSILPLIVNLPLYPNQQNLMTKLYVRNYIGLSTNCLDELKKNGKTKDLMQDLVNINDSMSTSIGISLGLMIISIIMIVCLIIFGIIIGIFYCGSGDEGLNKTKLCIIIFPFILTIATFVLCIILRSILKDYSKNDDVLSRSECVDEITYSAAQNYNDSIASAKTYTNLGLALSLLLLVISIFEFVRTCCL